MISECFITFYNKRHNKINTSWTEPHAAALLCGRKKFRILSFPTHHSGYFWVTHVIYSNIMMLQICLVMFWFSATSYWIFYIPIRVFRSQLCTPECKIRAISIMVESRFEKNCISQSEYKIMLSRWEIFGGWDMMYRIFWYVDICILVCIVL